MTEISANITQSDIDAARTVNRSVLQERFPDLDLSTGGVIDSLIVDGNISITAQNDANVEQAYLFQQLQQIANGTVTADDADVDRLMANYFLTREEDVPAYGNVVFVVAQSRIYTFQTGYRLRSGGQTFQLTQTYTVYPPATANVDFDVATNIALQNVYDPQTGDLYQFVLPITALDPGPAGLLVAGDALTVDQSFSGLGRVNAYENFRGGTVVETNAEFVTRGLQGLLARTEGGDDHYRVLVTDTIPNSDSKAVGVNSPMMTRDRNNTFAIATGGKTDLYCKSGAVATQAVLVEATVINPGLRTASITLSRAQSAGVYRLDLEGYFTTAPDPGITGDLTIQSITHLPWVNTNGFNPEMPTEIERAFSANQLIQIVFVDNRIDSGLNPVVSMTSVGETLSDSYQVTTEFQPDIMAIQDVLASDALRGTDILTKAAVPCTTTLSVVCTKPTEYNGPTAAQLEQIIASDINLLPISTNFISATTIANLIKDDAPSLIVDSISSTGLIYGQNGANIPVVQAAGRLTLPTNTAAKVAPYNTYFTTNSSLVTVTLV